jgi:hypothetical protein
MNTRFASFHQVLCTIVNDIETHCAYAMRSPATRKEKQVRRLTQVQPTVQHQAERVLIDVHNQPDLYLTRNLELGDMLFGYEQARQLLVKGSDGRPLLALAEQPGTLSGILARQLFDSSRAFKIDVFDVPDLMQHGASPDNGEQSLR